MKVTVTEKIPVTREIGKYKRKDEQNGKVQQVNQLANKLLVLN